MPRGSPPAFRKDHDLTRRDLALLCAACLVGGLFSAAPVGAADTKAPRIKRAVMKDSNGDGHPDRVVLTYNERIKHRADKDGKYPFAVKGYKIRKITRAKGRKLTIVLKGGDGPAAPTITYKRSARQPVKDRAGNQARGQTFTKIVSLLPEGSSQLEVNTGGPGKVLSGDGLIACEEDCTEIYDIGTEVQLTAVPSLDAVFLGWSGACSGLESACTVVLNDSRVVRAVFGYPVSVVVTGDGSVSSGDEKIVCPGSCVVGYEVGKRVVLTAAPADLSTFAGWSGACSGTGECSFRVEDGPVNVGASFEGEDIPTPLPTLSPIPLPTVSPGLPLPSISVL
jgi:hypothetical protein